MPREFGPSPEEMGIETKASLEAKFLKVAPNERQQDKITAVLKSEDYDLVGASSVEVSDSDRETVVRGLKTGEINNEQVDRLLTKIQAPFSRSEDRQQLSQDLLKSKDLGPTLAGFLTSRYRLASRSDVDPATAYGKPFETLFLEEFPTPSKLEAYFQKREDDLRKQAETGSQTGKIGLQAIQQEKTKWAALQNRIYGKRQEYWDQIKLMKDDKSGLDQELSTVESVKINDQPEVREKLPDRAEVIEKFLSYADADIPQRSKDQALEYSNNSPSAAKYADSLVGLMSERGQQELVRTSEQLRVKCLNKLLKYGINPSPYTMSQTWAMWDIGKQQYFFTHQAEADKKYKLADPFSEEKQNEIVARHVGWEIYQAYRSGNKNLEGQLNDNPNAGEIMTILKKSPKQNGTLSSQDLARLGQLL